MELFLSVLTSPLMIRSLIAALLVGITAPIVGTYLVHRRMAMMGDGIGHIALTGVALGWLAGTVAHVTPVDQWAVPGALIVSLLGAIVIELVRRSGRTSGDVAMAMLFYGGIAGGVLLIGLAGGTTAQLNSYLFGSISTVSWSDITIIAVLAVVILIVGAGLSPALYSVSNDEEFARSTGLPVHALSMTIAVLSAFTVAVSMRVVGALLVSAMMIVPVAIAQLVTTSFKQTMVVGALVGAVVSVLGLSFSGMADVSPGATIVVLAILVYVVGYILRTLLDRRRRRARKNAAALGEGVDLHPEVTA